MKNEAIFSKKATGRIYFECVEGKEIDAVLKQAIDSGEGRTITLQSIGKNMEGVEVCRSYFTWSMKLRRKN